MREQIKDVDRLRHIEECVCLTEVEKETSSYHHHANLVADEHCADAVRVARAQMSCYNLSSCHILFLNYVLL